MITAYAQYAALVGCTSKRYKILHYWVGFLDLSGFSSSIRSWISLCLSDSNRNNSVSKISLEEKKAEKSQRLPFHFSMCFVWFTFISAVSSQRLQIRWPSQLTVRAGWTYDHFAASHWKTNKVFSVGCL